MKKKLEKRDLEPNLEEFASNALDGKYVLIVGSSAVLKKDLYGGDGINMLLHFALKAEYGSDEFEIMKKQYPSFTEWETETKLDDVREAYCECKSYKLSDVVEPTLQQLMETRLFRVVLTTTLDPIIEMLMDCVWGEGNYDIICGPDDYSISGNQLDQYKDIINRERPLLCYVLGRIREDTTYGYSYALTESETLNMMAKWLINSTEGNSFMSSIRKDCLHVSIGCKFDDWLFRFFWYLITGESGKKDKLEGQVVVDLEAGLAEDVVNSSLSRYLKRDKSRVSFDDSRVFMRNAINAINDARRKRETICKQNIQKGHLFDSEKPSIFISYAHEDYSYVRRLYQKILNENIFDVWMDENELGAGDDLKEKIETAIRDRCRYFVPVLSSVVWGILKNKNDRWVLHEWEMARTTLEQIKKDKLKRNFDIIPVVTCDFVNKDEDSIQYRTFVERCFLKEAKNGRDEYPDPKYSEGVSGFIDFLKQREK